MKKKELPKVEPVKIKPLFGIKPSIWVSACYALAVLILIFLIGFLPGILHGKKRVTFTSAAGNAAVYVDGTYAGGTPFTSFIPSGSHSAEFKVADQTIDTVEFKVSHPVFFTWLFPRKMEVSSEKGINNAAFIKLTKSFLEDVANYSAILSYDNVYKYPPLFTNYAAALSSLKELSGTDYEDVLFTACAFITTDEMLEDAKNAYSLLNLDFDFSEVSDAVSEKSFKIETERLVGLSRPVPSSLETKYFNCFGTNINGTALDSYAVSESMYYYFVKDNPEWALDNKDNLVAQGLVDEYYLSGVSLSPSNTTRPVRNVSYYAAEAFCDWVSQLSGKNVFIPKELQWTTGANFSDSEFQQTLIPAQAKSGPTGVLGSVWEFTSTPYVPLLSLFDYSVYDILETYNVQAEVIIKGGSYVSNPEIDTYSIGTAPLSLCSDYMGFRIAWR